MRVVMLPLSVRALTIRERCERRFALTWRHRLAWPGPLEAGDKARMDLGQAFHMTVHRHRRGVPLGEMAPDLAELWTRFSRSPWFEVKDVTRVFSEQALHFSIGGMPVMVRCDEIRQMPDGRWRILDWKIGAVSDDALAAGWQTRLYRYALAEAGGVLTSGQGILPESIELVYWLVGPGRVVSMPYTAELHATDGRYLEQVARDVQVPLEKLSWPESLSTCQSCPFDSFCNLAPTPTPSPPGPGQRPVFLA